MDKARVNEFGYAYEEPEAKAVTAPELEQTSGAKASTEPGAGGKVSTEAMPKGKASTEPGSGVALIGKASGKASTEPEARAAVVDKLTIEPEAAATPSNASKVKME